MSYSINLEYFLPPFPRGPHSHEDSSKTSLPTRMPHLAITLLFLLQVILEFLLYALCSHGTNVSFVVILEPLYIGVFSVSSSTF